MISSDALGIMLAIFFGLIAIGLPVYLELRKERTAFRELHHGLNDMNSFQTRITISGIDEKIAMLYGYANDVSKWKGQHVIVPFMQNKIASDIRAIINVQTLMLRDQKEHLNSAIRLLIEAMKKEDFDVGPIDDVAKLQYVYK